MRRILPALLLASCSPSTPSPEFPEGFLWGAATAGFQVEMGCPSVAAEACEDRASDWYQWITDERLLEKKEALFFYGGPPSTGPGYYELYAEDHARAKEELGLKSLRISIEWSRIFPSSTVGVEASFEALSAAASPEGVAFYHRVLDDMRARGLVPLVTLNHYTLPLWLHDGAECHLDLAGCTRRGWLDEGIIEEARKYALFVGREYGALVDLWATLNEPLANTLAGYLSPGHDRVHPPGLGLRAQAAKTATMNMIYGHAALYDGLKEGDQVDADGDGAAAQVGLVFNIAAVRPKDPWGLYDEEAAANIHYLNHQLFLDATILGMLDEEAAGPEHAEKKEVLAGRMDYLGVNYYTRLSIQGTRSSVLPDFSPLMTMDPFGTELWEDYPRGLYEVLKWVHGRYGLPIYITEHGYPQPKTSEAEQERLMVEGLSWVKKAIDEGVDVRGFFWWSLIDNYEWNHGMEPMRFGLFAVDLETKARSRSPMARIYERIVGAHRVPADLAARHPIE